jgi:broad specificity phosphatase PhoE
VSRVLLVRHGDIAADMNRYWGQTDVPLSVHGLVQAERVGKRLAGEDIGVIYSSDLNRALDAATVVAGHHHVPVVPCPELREIDFGECEGLTFDEMKDRYPQTEGIWTAGGEGVSFPGGESVLALTERLTTFAERLRCESYGTALVVAHGGSLRVLVCCLAGLELSAWREMHIERASLSIVEINDRHGTLQLLNDVSHLQEGCGIA